MLIHSIRPVRWGERWKTRRNGRMIYRMNARMGWMPLASVLSLRTLRHVGPSRFLP